MNGWHGVLFSGNWKRCAIKFRVNMLISSAFSPVCIDNRELPSSYKNLLSLVKCYFIAVKCVVHSCYS